VRRAIRRFIEDPLAYELISGTFEKAQGVRVDVDSEGSGRPLSFRPIPTPKEDDAG
jgi:ATP-dependent Clp protease ATP-binding subunit ClpA